MSELKRCPCCGGENTIEILNELSPALKCSDCGLIMTIPASFIGNYKKELHKKWNTRKPVDDLLERLENASYWTQSTFDEDGYCNDDSEEVIDLYKAIEIVKEVMGYD